jgi:PAS domain S-box-containing protein
MLPDDMKTPLPRLGLRGRLLLVLLLAFAGLATLAIWHARQEGSEDIENAGRHLVSEVQLIAARHEAILSRVDTLLDTLLLSPEFRDGRIPANCEEIFSQRRRLESSFFQVGIAHPDGTVLCSTSAGKTHFQVGDREWFQDALTHSGMIVGHVITGRMQKTDLIPLAKAMRDPSGKVQAVFFVALQLETLRKELIGEVTESDYRIALIDGLGRLVLRHPDPGGLAGQLIVEHHFFVKTLKGKQEGCSTEIGLDGIEWLVAYTPFFRSADGSRYHLLLGQPTASIKAATKQRLVTSLTATLGLLLVTLLLFYWGSERYVLGPLRALANIARRFGSGDLDARSGLGVRSDEIGELTQALENMAHSLRDTTVSHERLKSEIDQKQAAERLLHFSQGMLEQASRIALVGSWSIDLRHIGGYGDKPVNWSPGMYRLIGYLPEQLPQPKISDFLARIHPEDLDMLIGMFQEALHERNDWQCVYRVIHPDNEVRTVSEIGNFICDEQGNPVSILGAAMDITAQCQVAEELRDSSARLRLALAGANAGSYEWNVLTGESLWSEELWALFGLERDPAGPSPDSWRKIVHPDDLQRVEQVTENAVARGEGFDIEWRIAMPDDRPPRWIMDRARPLRDPRGRIVRYLGIAIDITERKEVENSLQRYREHLEEMVDQRTASLMAARAEQRRLNRALRLLGDCNLLLARADDEVQLLDDLCRLVVESGGYVLAWFGIAEYDARKSVRIASRWGEAIPFLEALRVSWDGSVSEGQGPTGSAVRTGQTQVSQNIDKDSSMRPWQSQARHYGIRSGVSLAIIDEGGIEGALTLYSGEVNRFSGEEISLLEEMASNVSYGLQALRARRELERYRKNLETLVNERTREIGELNCELAVRAEEAEAASRAKSDFLATMSHEIRTPLNAVIGLTRLLVDSPLDRRQRDCAEKIQGAAQALRTLIDDILDFSKIEAGALQLEHAPFSLDSVLGTTASVISGGIGDKEVEAIFDVAPDVPDALIGDSLRLQQVLLNLASNAVKFTEQGAIVVTVRRCEAEDGRAMLSFSVRDTGIGIPQNQLDRIFEVFTQADSSTSRKYGGSGLGLAISARLVSAMGGRISVSSAVNWGSELQFTVPLETVKATQAEEGDLPKHLRILIVDDHPLTLDVLTHTCTARGWEVVTASCGARALEELASSSEAGEYYDLLLVDWRMEEMDGLEMLREARRNPQIAIPLVILMASANELAQAVAASDELTLDGIVAKPITPAALYKAILRAWNGEPVPLPIPSGNVEARLAGLRLLVAEDNELNQEMVAQILTRAGAEVTIAADGREAVECLRSNGDAFDAVLMDIQMPVMDGYQATRVIHSELCLTDLPIIAVTANARREDHEKSRRAGLVGHIAKPVDVDELFDLLVALGRMPARPGGSIAGQSGFRTSFASFDVNGGLRTFGGDANTYLKLLREFVSRHGDDVLAARDLLASGNPEAAARGVHALRGIAAYLCAPRIAALASEGEGAITEGRDAFGTLDRLQIAMTEFERDIDGFEDLLRESASEAV